MDVLSRQDAKTIYVLYTDNSILAGPSQQEIDKILEDLKKVKVGLTIEGTLNDFLGINIDRKDDGTTLHLSQPKLIEHILNDLRLLDENIIPKDMPMVSSRLLPKHQESAPFDGSFHYRSSTIGKLNYLEKGNRSDLAYAVHQCARFSTDPKVEHGNAIQWIRRYLVGAKTLGTFFKPNPAKGLEVFVDASFPGCWDPTIAWEDRDTARSHHGYVSMHANCPIVTKSQLQTEVCLSATEPEYIGLSYAIREAIPIMETLDEMGQLGFKVHPTSEGAFIWVWRNSVVKGT
jgi:hypothetical protein